MLLCNASRPNAWPDRSQWFGLADAGGGIARNRVHKFQNSKRDLAIMFHPELEILAKLGLEYDDPVRLRAQDGARLPADR